MKINIIGNGSLKSKNMNACTLIDDHILIDVPNGVTKHLKTLGYNIYDIDTIFITHLHGDHFFDLPFFLLDRYFNNVKDKITIICPAGTSSLVRKLLEIGFPNDFEDIINFINPLFLEVQFDDVIDVNNLNVQVKEVVHGRMKPSFGYVINSFDKTIGVSGDSMICDSIDEIILNSGISILDMSLKGSSNNSHMGYDDIKDFCFKYPDKTIIATHMDEDTLKWALDSKIDNLIIPDINFEIVI